MRRNVLIASLLSVFALITVAATAPHDLLLYNSSPSIPVGFYLRVNEPVQMRTIVTVRAAEVAPGYAAVRSFTGDGDRFIKRIVASEGDRVCAQADRIAINGRTIAHRAWQDSMGRLLPQWNGCRLLRSDEMFLLGETPDSFDSRYFGIVRADQVEGVWRKL
jgi:conjugative transfer signal peptidase TraF